MKRKILFPIITIISLLIFIQCKKCHNKFLGNIDFTQTDLNIVPYNGTENIIFKDSIGDSLYFHSGFRQVGAYQKVPIHSYEQDQCEPDFYYYANNYTYFKEGNNDFGLDLELSFMNYGSIKSFHLQIHYADSQNWFYDGNFTFANLHIFAGREGGHNCI